MAGTGVEIMNDGYSAPCGMVMGVQDSDPRSSKELRKWQGKATVRREDASEAKWISRWMNAILGDPVEE